MARRSKTPTCRRKSERSKRSVATPARPTQLLSPPEEPTPDEEPTYSEMASSAANSVLRQVLNEEQSSKLAHAQTASKKRTQEQRTAHAFSKVKPHSQKTSQITKDSVDTKPDQIRRQVHELRNANQGVFRMFPRPGHIKLETFTHLEVILYDRSNPLSTDGHLLRGDLLGPFDPDCRENCYADIWVCWHETVGIEQLCTYPQPPGYYPHSPILRVSFPGINHAQQAFDSELDVMYPFAPHADQMGVPCVGFRV